MILFIFLTQQTSKVSFIKSPDELKKHRVDVITKFSSDYEVGKLTKRYLVEELPKLNIKNDTFDIALIAHFLFLYSERYNYEFHKKSIYEAFKNSGKSQNFSFNGFSL